MLTLLSKTYPRCFCVVVTGGVVTKLYLNVYSVWEMLGVKWECCVDTLFAIWSHYMLSNVFDTPFSLRSCEMHIMWHYAAPFK